MEADQEGVKANISKGMALLEQANTRLRRKSGIANANAFNTEAAVTGQRVDSSSPTQLMARGGSDYADIASENMGTFGKAAVKDTIGLIVNAPAIVATMLGHPELGALYFAALTAGQDAAQLNKQGYSPLEATTHATIKGVIAYLTTKAMAIGFQKVMSFSAGWETVTLAQKITKLAFNAAGSFGVGFTRAARGVLAGNLADMMILGDRSRFAYAAAVYQANGMSEIKARAAAAFDIFIIEPLQTGAETGAVMAGFAVLSTTAGPGNSSALQVQQPQATAQGGGTAAQSMPPAPTGEALQPFSGMQPAHPVQPNLPALPAPPGYVPAANSAAGHAGAVTALAIADAPAAVDKYIGSGLNAPDAVAVAAMELYQNHPGLAGGSMPPGIPGGAMELPPAAAALQAPPQVIKAVGDTAQEMQTLSDRTALDLYDKPVSNAYLQFGLNPTNGNALSVYNASLQSLGDAVAQQQAGNFALTTLQIDAINTQADVVQGRMNMLLVQAGEAQADGTNFAQQTIAQAEQLVTALQTLPPGIKTKIGYDGVFNAFLSATMNGGNAQLAQTAMDKARAGARDALKDSSMDAETRAALQALLGEIDSGEGMGDNGEQGTSGSTNNRFPRTEAEYGDLAKDPARGGGIDDKGRAERDVAIGLENQGKVGKLVRDLSGRAEFIDTATGQKWDVKGFYSRFAPRGYTLTEAINNIKRSIAEGEYVMLDTRNLYPEHLTELLGEIERQGLIDGVLIWP